MSDFIDQVSRDSKIDAATVRKVVEAMRVPTPKMLEMANHVFADRIWRQMIDEALKTYDRDISYAAIRDQGIR